MKFINCWQNLYEYGIDVLTGEACGLSYRILCDVTTRGKKVLEKCFGIPNMTLAENWNNGSKSDPHVGSIMLPHEMLVPLGIFALLENGCTEVWLYGDYSLRGIETRDDPDYVNMIKEHDKGLIRRTLKYGGTAGDRNVHEMTGRIV